jgi:hypothetical protein
MLNKHWSKMDSKLDCQSLLHTELWPPVNLENLEINFDSDPVIDWVWLL